MYSNPKPMTDIVVCTYNQCRGVVTGKTLELSLAKQLSWLASERLKRKDGQSLRNNIPVCLRPSHTFAYMCLNPTYMQTHTNMLIHAHTCTEINKFFKGPLGCEYVWGL